MLLYAWLMPFIGIVAVISYFISGNANELALGVVAILVGVFIYARRLH